MLHPEILDAKKKAEWKVVVVIFKQLVENYFNIYVFEMLDMFWIIKK